MIDRGDRSVHQGLLALALLTTTAALTTQTALEWKLLKATRRAIWDYEMIKPGDTVAVAVSGGKDSSTLSYLLRELQEKSLLGYPFELRCVHLDQQQPGHDYTTLERWITQVLGLDFDAIIEDTYSIVLDRTKPGKSYCRVCSRLRRGILYTYCLDSSATLALGHHRDDALETLLLNMVHNGQLKAMPARYVADRGVNVVRPLIYCAEDAIAAFASEVDIPILPCNLCGTQPSSQRQNAKLLLNAFDAFADRGPDARTNMLRALTNVRPSHLLDQNLRFACGLDPMTGQDLSASDVDEGGAPRGASTTTSTSQDTDDSLDDRRPRLLSNDSLV